VAVIDLKVDSNIIRICFCKRCAQGKMQSSQVVHVTAVQSTLGVAILGDWMAVICSRS
jgi:hypothetical protein